MTRPLGFTNVSDAPTSQSTIRHLSYNRARPYSGNHPELGAKLSLATKGISIEGFAFAGRLANEAGLDELRNSLTNFNPDNLDRPRTHAWGGGRLQWNFKSFLWRGEAILSKDSTLRRFGAYTDISHRHRRCTESCNWSETLFLARLETYRILDADKSIGGSPPLRSSALAHAATWDFHA